LGSEKECANSTDDLEVGNEKIRCVGRTLRLLPQNQLKASSRLTWGFCAWDFPFDGTKAMPMIFYARS